MTRALGLGALALLLCGPAPAQDFSAGSEASSWNLLGERQARFEARVVDVLCELTGDCPENCGDGARQIGLVRRADDVLVLPMKNGEPVFSGAVDDLAPYCGQMIEVDGLMVGEADVTEAPFYMVQRIRPEGESEFVAAKRFTGAWAARNPDVADPDGKWFRLDPHIGARIAESGYLGLGPDTDAAFFAEWF